MGIYDAWQSLSGRNSDQKQRGKNPLRHVSKMNPSTVRLPLRPTEDLAGLETGNSVTGIRAETFRKKSPQVDYALLV